MVGYSTALSHIILAGTGFYCLGALGKRNCLNDSEATFLKYSFGIIALHSALGVWRWGNPTYGYKISKLYTLTSILQDLFVLPCIVTALWLHNGYITEIAYAHTFISVIPLLAYIFIHKNEHLLDAFLGMNCLSLGVISQWHENYYGVTSAMSYALNHFLIKRDILAYIFKEYFDIPTQDLYNYAMCFFALFALRAVLY